MIKESIATLVEGKSLTFKQASGAMEEIMGGEATPAQIGAFLSALRAKGESADEIAGLATVMRAKATPVKLPPVNRYRRHRRRRLRQLQYFYRGVFRGGGRGA